MIYSVFIDSNSRYQDEEARYEHGRFDTAEAAVVACKDIIDTYLENSYQKGMTGEELYRLYTTFGEDPFIVSNDPACVFSARDYARQRCDEMCANNIA